MINANIKKNYGIANLIMVINVGFPLSSGEEASQIFVWFGFEF